jgi:hypothetical protein
MPVLKPLLLSQQKFYAEDAAKRLPMLRSLKELVSGGYSKVCSIALLSDLDLWIAFPALFWYGFGLPPADRPSVVQPAEPLTPSAGSV